MNTSGARLAAIRFLIGCGGLVAAEFASAEVPRSNVVVELRECEPELEGEVRRIVGVELRATVVLPTNDQGAVTRVVVTCRGSEVDLRLADARSSKRLERTVALSEAAPTARARLLALATAELVAASREELESNPAPKVAAIPPPQPVAPAAMRAAVDQHRPRAMVDAIGVARGFPGSRLFLFGAGARANVNVARVFTLLLDVTAEWGSVTRATGQVTAQAIGGALGIGWGVEAGTACIIMPWVGVRGGAARLNGEAYPGAGTLGKMQTGPFLSPELGLSATLFPAAIVHGTVAVSAGASLAGVQGEVSADRDVSMMGPWAAVVIGAGFAMR